MTRKKNKFLTFFFSLMPGAAHMYMGFSKIGISLMGGFFFIIFLASTFNLDAALFLLPIIWFYSFFDANNKNSTDDVEFYQLEDDYLIHISQIDQFQKLWDKKGNIVIALVLIFGGIYLLVNPIMNKILDSNLLSPDEADFIWSIYRMIPQCVLAICIILFGIRLIRGKKQELEETEGSDYDGRTY